MLDEELEKRFVESYPEFCRDGKPLSLYYDLWEAGAEFGRNDANEWHYVKDELPETSGKYLVYTCGDSFVLEFDTDYNAFGYWVESLGDDWGVQDEDFETVEDRGEDEVIAWKEIILPNIE